MKKAIQILGLVIVVMLSATSCKTTEENFKSAYDIAVKKNEKGADDNITAIIEQEKRLNEYSVVNGDSVRVLSQTVTMIDGDASAMKKYGVVVGEYKQVFNARSFRNRINTTEKDTPSYVVMNPLKKYYVVYKGFDSKNDAASFLKKKSNFKMTLPVGDPWILELIY